MAPSSASAPCLAGDPMTRSRLLWSAVALLLVVRAVTAPQLIDPTSDSLVGQCVVVVAGELRPAGCSGAHDGRIVQKLSPGTLADPCAVGVPVRYLRDDVVLCVEGSR